MRESNGLDLRLKQRVARMPGGERVTNCFLCGTCTAGCPISRLHEDYNPRQLMRRVLLGKTDVLADPVLWQCMQCHVCTAHCPQDVRTADVIRAIRQLAVDEHRMTEELMDAVVALDEQQRLERIERIQGLVDEFTAAKGVEQS